MTRTRNNMLNDPKQDGYIVIAGEASADLQEWADEVTRRRMPFVAVITGSGDTQLTCSIANLVMLPAEGHATAEVGQRLRRLMQAVLAKHRKATLFHKSTTVSAMGRISLDTAKHLAADIAVLTGVTLPLVPFTEQELEAFAA